jgi:HEAT repeat protein
MVAPALMKMTKDPDPNVEANVVAALASLGDKIVPKAIEALKKPDVRELAVKVITRMGPKAAATVEPLIEAAKGADPALTTKINFALAAIGPAAAPATEMLVEAIGSKDQGVRESALLALRRIGPGAKAAVQPLIAKTQSGDSFDAVAAAWALARIVPADADAAAKAVPALTRGLSDPDEQVRLESADALATWGPAAKAAAAALKKAAESDDSAAVRAAAEAALSHPAAKP